MSLPFPDLLQDIVVGCQMFSFMDGFSSYNQICMAPEDVEKTTFYTSIEVFCYTIVPFGLKNAGGHVPESNVEYFMIRRTTVMILLSCQRKERSIDVKHGLSVQCFLPNFLGFVFGSI